MPQALFTLPEIVAMLQAVGLEPAVCERVHAQATAVTAARPMLGTDQIAVFGGVGIDSRRGFVALRLGAYEQQMTPAEAIEAAGMLHACAATAICDEGVMRLLDDLHVAPSAAHRGALLQRLHELKPPSRDPSRRAS